MKVEISQALRSEIDKAIECLEDSDANGITYEDAEFIAHRALVNVQIERVMAKAHE